MQRIMMKSKIHQATVTGCYLHYSGSLAIDEALLEEADILPNEKVQVININNGERFETYAIKAPRGSGKIEMNGGAALKGSIGDQILIITYATFDDEEAKAHEPQVLLMKGTENRNFQRP